MNINIQLIINITLLLMLAGLSLSVIVVTAAAFIKAALESPLFFLLQIFACVYFLYSIFKEGL